jgi:uncharacterized protein
MSEPKPELITDLTQIAASARQREDDYEAFDYYLELLELTDAELDTLVERLAHPILAGIDCTQCANCCRNLDIYLTEEDGKRLAEGTFIPLNTLLETTIDLERAQPEEEWGIFRHKPCQYLNGNLCSIYPHRPESCAIYPVFTPDFRWMFGNIRQGAWLCPIIYNLIDHLQIELKW